MLVGHIATRKLKALSKELSLGRVRKLYLLANGQTSWAEAILEYSSAIPVTIAIKSQLAELLSREIGNIPKAKAGTECL